MLETRVGTTENNEIPHHTELVTRVTNPSQRDGGHVYAPVKRVEIHSVKEEQEQSCLSVRQHLAKPN